MGKLKLIILRVLDLFLCSIFMIIGFFVGLIILFYLVFNNKRKKVNCGKDRRLLIFCEAADYDALKAKGVVSLLDNWLIGGYFKKVYIVHFPTPKKRLIRERESIEIIELGVKARFLKQNNMIFGYTVLNALWYFWQVFTMRGFTKNEISVIHGAGVHHTALAALFLYHLTGIPTCISVHSDDEGRYEQMKKYGSFWTLFNMRYFTVLVHRFVFSHAPRVFIIRESLGRWVKSMGAKPERICLFPHGIDIENFLKPYGGNIRSEFNLSSVGLVVFAGRLSQENYVYDMIEIAQKVTMGIEDIVFVIIGDGPERYELEGYVRIKNLHKYFRFLGFLPQNKVYEFRKNASVNLCLMAGYSLIEAALSKRPIISYDVEWHHELIKNDETGFLVPEHDVEAAANAIVTLLADHRLAERLGENAFQLALERHDARKNDKEKIKLYEELKNLNN